MKSSLRFILSFLVLGLLSPSFGFSAGASADAAHGYRLTDGRDRRYKTALPDGGSWPGGDSDPRVYADIAHVETAHSAAG